jgi:hypothetical protein
MPSGQEQDHRDGLSRANTNTQGDKSMADAFIYDAVRTPRGRGKKDGSLHEVPTPRLAARMLEALRERNGLDTVEGR